MKWQTSQNILLTSERLYLFDYYNFYKLNIYVYMHEHTYEHTYRVGGVSVCKR